jgi:hypothetical protein
MRGIIRFTTNTWKRKWHLFHTGNYFCEISDVPALYNDVSTTAYITVHPVEKKIRIMNWKDWRRKPSWPVFKYSLYLERLRKTMKGEAKEMSHNTWRYSYVNV